MRLMMFLRATPDTEAGIFPPDSKRLFAEMGQLMEDMAKAGVLLAGEGLLPSSKGKRLKFTGGKITSVTDGPFTETKELVAGYCLIEVKSWDEAMEWATRFAKVERNGETELRPLYEASDFPPEIFAPEDAEREQSLRDALQRKAAKR